MKLLVCWLAGWLVSCLSQTTCVYIWVVGVGWYVGRLVIIIGWLLLAGCCWLLVLQIWKVERSGSTGSGGVTSCPAVHFSQARTHRHWFTTIQLNFFEVASFHPKKPHWNNAMEDFSSIPSAIIALFCVSLSHSSFWILLKLLNLSKLLGGLLLSFRWISQNEYMDFS